MSGKKRQRNFSRSFQSATTAHTAASCREDASGSLGILGTYWRYYTYSQLILCAISSLIFHISFLKNSDIFHRYDNKLFSLVMLMCCIVCVGNLRFYLWGGEKYVFRDEIYVFLPSNFSLSSLKYEKFSLTLCSIYFCCAGCCWSYLLNSIELLDRAQHLWLERKFLNFPLLTYRSTYIARGSSKQVWQCRRWDKGFALKGKKRNQAKVLFYWNKFQSDDCPKHPDSINNRALTWHTEPR